MSEELQAELNCLETSFDALKGELRFSQPYDQSEAIISIYAGAGGTDAQDWAHMLLRMYTRWADAHDYVVATVPITRRRSRHKKHYIGSVRPLGIWKA